jgi:hypothetical protein
MNRIQAGLYSGALGTFVTGAMLLMNNALHSVPEIHVIRTVAAMLGATDHFMAGVVAFVIIGICGGSLFAAFAPRLPVRGYFRKSLAFAGATWLFLMLVGMPLTGAGFFGLHGGMIVPEATLVLNLAYWLVLGLTYRWLQAPAAQVDASQTQS